MKTKMKTMSILVFAVLLVHLSIKDTNANTKANLRGQDFVVVSDKTYDLTVSVEGVESALGNIRIGLYNQDEGWPDETKSYKGQLIAAKVSSVEVQFKGLKLGKYAVAAYHDANENEKLDTGIFGIPKEGYGFSRGALGTFGPPSYKNAAFDLGTYQSIKIKLRY